MVVPRPLVVAALWIACLGYAGQRLHHARTEFDNPPDAPADEHRADGNSGHALIDFGGQWVMGRMVVTGHADELYDRNRQWELVWQAFPPEGESEFTRRNAFPTHRRDPGRRAEDIRHDAGWMMHWFMGRDSDRWPEAGSAVALPFAADAVCPNPFAAVALTAVARQKLTPELVEEVNRPAVGGPLYPPIHGFLYAPLALDDKPRRAYRTFQVFSLGLTFLAGLGVRVLSRGRIWWPAATLVILLYPGYRSGLDLAQNNVVTLAILVWGWAAAARGRDGLGGAVWGLLAFKPVWAAAFFLVPLLMGRWRFCGAMLATGAALAAATLPFVGLHSWFDWLEIGREASALYQVNKNWIGLSRDLADIPRRMLIDFTLPEGQRSNRAADLAGWGLWVAVFAATVGVYLWRADRRNRSGLGAGFLFLGAYLCCYRFMYYDAVVSVLAFAVLFADPARLVGPAAPGSGWPGWVRWVRSGPVVFLAALLLVENWLLHFGLEATVKAVAGGRAELALNVDSPWDTLVLLGLWGWLGVRLLAGRDGGEPAANAS